MPPTNPQEDSPQSHKEHKILLWIAALILLFAFQVHAASEADVDRVASKLSCWCGTCPHLVVTQCGCSKADEIKKDVAKMLDSGMTEKQIIQSFVDKYGATALSSPPKSGFNLAAYSLPFAGFLLGGSLLVVFLRHQKNGKQPPTPGGSPTPEGSSPDRENEYYDEMLEKELEKRK